MRTPLLINVLCLFILPAAFAQNNTYTDRSVFNASCSGCTLASEGFSGFTNGQSVDSLFSGVITFADTVPTIFSGSWQHNCDTSVLGRALISEPRFKGSPMVMTFPKPVFGVGAGVYDDHDGTPLINTITLTMITTNGDTLIVSDSCNSLGDGGFLGGTSPDLLTTAIWSIDNNNGNMEVDSVTLLARFPLKREATTRTSNGSEQLVERFIMYPNPASSKLFIESPEADLREIIIHDIYGKRVFAKTVDGLNKLEVDLTSMAAGIYVLQLYPVDATLRFKNKKFVIDR